MMSNRYDETNIWALLPIKLLYRAKSRLSCVLGPGERKVLARAMLCDGLDTLARVDGLSGILVVTDDAEASAIVMRYGATVISGPAEDGLNGAVRHGMRWLEARGEGGVIIVPADIPFASVDEFAMVLEAMQSNAVVLVPATRDGGTNILATAPPNFIVPQFGLNSFIRHVRVAQSAGIEPRRLFLHGVGHDVDVMADLTLELDHAAGTRTQACLRQFAYKPLSCSLPPLQEDSMHAYSKTAN